MLMVESLPRKDEWPLVVYAERHIRNGQPHLQEHLLIERLHLRNHLRTSSIVIHVSTLEKDGQVVHLADGLGVFVEVAGVGFQVDDAFGF